MDLIVPCAGITYYTHTHTHTHKYGHAYPVHRDQYIVVAYARVLMAMSSLRTPNPSIPCGSESPSCLVCLFRPCLPRLPRVLRRGGQSRGQVDECRGGLLGGQAGASGLEDGPRLALLLNPFQGCSWVIAAYGKLSRRGRHATLMD
jgi:hypothetical protein